MNFKVKILFVFLLSSSFFLFNQDSVLSSPPEVPPLDIITSPDGNVTVGVDKTFGGAIVYYKDERIPLDPQINYDEIPEPARKNIIDYSNGGTLFQTALWTLPSNLNEQKYCLPEHLKNGICPDTLPFNNPTQGGFLGDGLYGNPNPTSVNVNNNEISVETRLVNYNFGYAPPDPLDTNDPRLQTNFWFNIKIFFHPVFSDVVVIDQKITYCKDLNDTCKNKPITLQDSQPGGFAAGQNHPMPQYRGPFTRAAYRKTEGNAILDTDSLLGVDPTTNIKILPAEYQDLGYRTENWVALLHKSQPYGIGYSVLNYQPIPPSTKNLPFGYRTVLGGAAAALGAIEPEIAKFVSSGVTRVRGATSDIYRYQIEPGGWYKFRAFLATGKLQDNDPLDIRWKLIRAEDPNLMPPADVPYEDKINGYVDRFTCDNPDVAGWAKDDRDLSRKVTIRLEIYPVNDRENKITRTVRAKSVRQDLKQVCPPNGACAFGIKLGSLPSSFAGKKLRVDVYGVSAGGQNRIYSPKSNLIGPCPTEPKLGDANGDNQVDGEDYTIWLNHYDTMTLKGAAAGDFNKDRKVDGLDYIIWLNNYGK